MKSTGRKGRDRRFGFELFECVRDDGQRVWVSVPPDDRAEVWLEVIRQEIRDSGMTTYQLAQRSGVPVQTIDRILVDQEPKLGTVEKLAAVLGIRLVVPKR